MKLLTNQQQESYENGKICYICKKNFENKYVEDKKYCKVRDHCHYMWEYSGATYSICNLKYSVPKTIPIVSHKLWLSFYHKRVSKRIWKRIYLFRRKHWKIHYFYSSKRIRTCNNW